MNHHRLHCYQRLMEVARTVPTLLARFPEGHAYLTDQFKRALSSRILNLVEWNGRITRRERGRFFTIATASLSEVDAIIGICQAYHPKSADGWIGIREELRIVSAMIRKLSQVNSVLS